MDFKTKNYKRPSTNIQYVRNYEESSDFYKSKNCFKFIVQYKTSFIAAIFSIVLLICLVIMMIYVTLQSDKIPEFTKNSSEPWIIQEQTPISSQISLNPDSKIKDTIIELSTDEKLIWPELKNNFKTNRLKRQIPQNVPNCMSRHEECKIILDSIKGITKSMHEKLNRLSSTLVNQGILKESDPKEAKFRKIVECLQCRNSINYKDDEYGDVDPFFPDISRNINDRISDLLPFLEDHTYENDETYKEEENCDESTEKIQTTLKPFQETPRLNYRFNSEFPHRMSNFNRDQSKAATNRNMYPSIEQNIFHHKAIDVSNDVSCEEFQVSPNVDATPIILPTAETTQTSQQIQFTPQNSWPYIPVCFYGPPSSSNSYQFKQNPRAPFFTAYTSTQGTLKQPIKLFVADDQPQKFSSISTPPQQFQPNSFLTPQLLQPSPVFHSLHPPSHPAPQFSYPQFSQPSQSSQFSQPAQASQLSQVPVQDQQNLPYYCTYILLPSNYQQQISPTHNWANFQFADKSKKTETSTKEFTANVDQFNQSHERSNANLSLDEVASSNQQQQSLSRISSESKQQFSKNSNNETVTEERLEQRKETAETTVPRECFGFMCNPPYRKCLESHQRCDGQVNCMGAEDEVDCPNNGYYTRFHNSQFNLPLSNNKSRMMSTVSTFEEDRKQTTMATFEDERRQSTISRFEEERSRNSSNASSLDQIRQNNATSNITEIDDEFGKTASPKERSERTTTFANLTTMISTNSATERSFETETTTFVMMIPDMPHQFICKRIIQTIPLEKRCDNVFDCEDTSDEKDCRCKDYLKLDHPSAICDGHVDCLDGSDEEECEICKENEYHCYRSGSCIPKRKRCDQSMDCKLNEDELDCFTLTDGHQVKLDLDKRPHLNLEGVLTRYDNGAWRPSCFKAELRNEMKRMGAGQKICEYLGFRNAESAVEILVQSSKLVERVSLKDIPLNKNYSLNFKPSKRDINNTCDGLQILCKPILDRKLNVHLKIDSKSKKRSYIWPWEASIFVDGNYYCSAVLLENNLLLSSSKCSENIDLHKNYTAALFGVSPTKFLYKYAYEQSSPIVNIKSLNHSDASLFRLKDNINMTRYVQPLYLAKRIFPASRDDTCIAIGVNSHHQRQMKFLQPIIRTCPKCHRCYIDKSDTSMCSENNSTLVWNGFVVCLSSGGWYPAAVFQGKNENCGFATKQILNSIDYIHAHLSQAIDEVVEQFEAPHCEGIRCNLGKCVPKENLCDGIRDCRDGIDENHEQCQKIRERCENGISKCKCNKAELSCGNGKCIPKEMFCDGKVDCPNGIDEPVTCNCGEYLKLTEPRRYCDGRRHCFDKSDESYDQCMCKDSSFKCLKSTHNDITACIPQDFVCDGESDCPEGEDESEEVCWTLKPDKRDPRGKGEVMRRSFGVFQSECFPKPIESQREVTNMCAKLGFKSGILVDGSRLSESQFVPRNDFFMFQLNNNTWITMRNDVPFGVWKKSESNCYKLFLQCF